VALPEEQRRAPLPLHPLPAFLADTGQAKLLYIAKAWLLVFIPSVALSVGISLLVQKPAGPEFGASGLTLFFLLVVFAPVVETLLMIPPLLLIDRFAGHRPAIVGSAIFWGVLHSLAAPLWGLIVWWPFLILSAIFLVWRRERGLWTAMLIVTAVHALQNAVAGSTLFLG
jgi:hypothetical protein